MWFKGETDGSEEVFGSRNHEDVFPRVKPCSCCKMSSSGEGVPELPGEFLKRSEGE